VDRPLIEMSVEELESFVKDGTSMNAPLLWRWLKRIPHETFQWILHATPLWLALAIPVSIWLLTGLFFPSPEIQLEASGLVLQILGLFVIAHGLNALRKELRDDGQGFGAAMLVSLGCLGRIFYPIRRPAILAIGSGHVHASGQIVGVSVKSGDLNGRVEALEQEMRSVRAEMRETARDRDSHLKELTGPASRGR
jgi:hypothetical protein